MTRKPTTLHEHFRADPRGADSFGKWIEDRIWELLQKPATWDCAGTNGDGVSLSNGKLHEFLVRAIEYTKTTDGKRFNNTVRLFDVDGSIVKHWPAENI